MSFFHRLTRYRFRSTWGKTYISPTQFQSDCDELVEYLRDAGDKYDIIITMPRGGYQSFMRS